MGVCLIQVSLYNDSVTHSLPAFFQKRIQHVQNAAVSFVLNRYCSEKDVLKLGWCPTLENTQYNILKLGHWVLFSEMWPKYLKFSRQNSFS